MNYYLNLFTPATWNAFGKHGSTTAGLAKSTKRRAAKVNPGDVFVCYLVQFSRWCGALEVQEGPYIDQSPIFAPANDKYCLRFRVKPLAILEPEHAIPIGELWNQLNRTKYVDRRRPGWAYRAGLGASLTSVDPSDGPVIVQRLLDQARVPKPFALSEAEKRILFKLGQSSKHD